MVFTIIILALFVLSCYIIYIQFLKEEIEDLKDKRIALQNNYDIHLKKLSVIEDKITNEKQTIENEIASFKRNADFEIEQRKKEQEYILSLYDDEENQYLEKMTEFSQIRNALNQAILREKKLTDEEKFYSINITEDDKSDIYNLLNLSYKMNRKDLIPNLIWNSIIKRPSQEMIKRVTENRKISGIYKITYLPSGEAYIGKTTDIKTRWQNHIETALGMAKVATSTLHVHMRENGVWNYSFEIIEEVEKDKLAEREKYYINLYDTKNYGLNMKNG